MASSKPKSRTRRKRDDLTTADVRSFIESGQIDKIADYAKRGRLYAQLTDGELSEDWRQAVRVMAKDPFSFEPRRIEDDLRAEINLRGLQPPFDSVKEAFEEFISKVGEFHEELKKRPDDYQRANEELVRDIDEFKASRERSKN